LALLQAVVATGQCPLRAPSKIWEKRKANYHICSAAQGGAGIISGLDARNATAKAKGTGGLVQVSSYLSGLSGGSWLVSSMVFHDFPDMHDLVLGNTNEGGNLNGWFLDRDLALPNGLNPFDNNNEHYFGYVVAFTIYHTGCVHLSTGVFSGALTTRAELGSTLP
jgi:hypothetical protein